MPENIYPYSYRAFGLNILSQLAITGFETAMADPADVFIHEGPVPENLEKVINHGVLYQANDHEFLLRLENIATYWITNGNEITVQRLGDATTGEISAFLTGTSFGALLHQRKLLPLHASTVIFHGKCLVFAGLSGAGKTTLAAAIIKAGGILVADDISVIDFSNPFPEVRAAFPAVKIWADSLKHLGISTEGLEHVRGEIEKFYLPVVEFSRDPKAIHHLFILNSHNKNEWAIKPLQGVDKFRVLKRHTYLFRGIPKTGLEQNHFKLVNQLASHVPVSMITRPSGKFNTENLVRIIADHL